MSSRFPLSQRLRLPLGILIWAALFTGTPLAEVRGDLAPSDPQQVESRASTDPQNCQGLVRDLNPAPPDLSVGTSLDQTFAQAYEAAVSGVFSEAVVLSEKAGDFATCDGDRHHAQAGSMAAQEALDLTRQDLITRRPTQFFWIQLQDLTEENRCIRVR